MKCAMRLFYIMPVSAKFIYSYDYILRMNLGQKRVQKRKNAMFSLFEMCIDKNTKSTISMVRICDFRLTPKKW